MAATASSSSSPLILSNLQKSSFLGSPIPFHLSFKTPQKPNPSLRLKPLAKFNLFEIMGGRGLCGGEEGVEKELKKTIETPSNPPMEQGKEGPRSGGLPPLVAGEAAFEKELSGLTGGFPGGEKGLKKFIEENPPPPTKVGETGLAVLSAKPRPPELPLLMPGMIVIVKNPKNAYHMYCGIIQRITDGKAGVLFEGGNWDRLITFRLDELERREKGPPMVNPKSCILEPLLENKA